MRKWENDEKDNLKTQEHLQQGVSTSRDKTSFLAFYWRCRDVIGVFDEVAWGAKHSYKNFTNKIG